MWWGIAQIYQGFRIGEYIQLGKYYDKPILWRCADRDENGLLIISDKAICRKPFDADASKGLPEEFINSHRRHYSGYTNYWGDSNIRSWLNSASPAGEVTWLCGQPPVHKNSNDVYFNAYGDEKGFLADGNFTQSERDVIKEVTQKSLLDRKDAELAVGGDSNGWKTIRGSRKEDLKDFIENQYDNLIYEYMTDKVFLLDIKQLWNMYQKGLLEGEGYYAVRLTQEAVDNDEENQFLINNGQQPIISTRGTNFWLRTPFGGDFLLNVQDNRAPGMGVFTSRPIADGYYENMDIEYVNNNQGIRPAFYLNEENAQILSGSGTEEDPYVLDGKPQDKVHVYSNGWELTFDVPPMRAGETVLVPMRKIFETMGAEVGWDEETQTAWATKGETVVEIPIGNTSFKINGQETAFEIPAEKNNDRTMVPLHVISDAMGATVDWMEEQQRVEIHYCVY